MRTRDEYQPPWWQRRLPLLLAVVFAAFHLIVIGGTLLESPPVGMEDWRGYVLVIYDFPLFMFCRFTPVCALYHGPGSLELFLFAGTLMYAFAGFLIGAVIDWIRPFIELL